MRHEKYLRRMIDSICVILLPFLMAYSLIGQLLHEWLGIIMFCLWFFHLFLNRKWFIHLFHGTYSIQRKIYATMNLVLCIFMIMLMISGLSLSTILSIPIQMDLGMMRSWHMLASHWMFLLLTIHAGFHLHIFFPRKGYNKKGKNMLILMIWMYTFYALWKRNLFAYLSNTVKYAFYDANESLFLFLFDYIVIMLGLMLLGNITIQWIKRKKMMKKDNL